MEEITDQAAAECAAITTRLAERKTDCSWCRGTTTVEAVGETTGQRIVGPCLKCSGTGKVAEFPWLRRDSYLPGLRGWVPRLDIPIEEALAAVGAHRLAILWEWREHCPLEPDAKAVDIRLAFWQAVEKVLSHDQAP